MPSSLLRGPAARVMASSTGAYLTLGAGRASSAIARADARGWSGAFEHLHGKGRPQLLVVYIAVDRLNALNHRRRNNTGRTAARIVRLTDPVALIACHRASTCGL
jgi:hypothetical protein